MHKFKLYELDLSRKGFDAVRLTERSRPEPGHGEVLLRIHAVSLNFRDLLIINHLYPVASGAKGLIPCSDGAGEVVAVGEGATRFRKGDRVAGAFFQGWIDGTLTYPAIATSLGGAVSGMLAEYVVLREQGLVPVPDALSFEEACTLPCAGVTAWHALVETGKLTAGQSVLVLGTGGVSIFGLQIGKAMGARVIVTSSSDDKLEYARAMGADGLINYRKTPDWDQEVLRLTEGAGVDHILEVGGAGTLPKSLQSAALHGQVNIIGVLTGLTNNIDFLPVLAKNLRLQGIFVGSRAMLESLMDAVGTNSIRPVIDKIFPFEEAVEAYRHLASAQHIGKVLIRL
jgi:NADPH:quinone reductase-like Zn-dependent oxidoreductase